MASNDTRVAQGDVVAVGRVGRLLGDLEERLLGADPAGGWAATATEWFASSPWRLRPGPSIVATLEHADDFSTATCELRLPVEPS